ncbi:MAG TPA: hypothetical protein VKU44_09615, partial [Terriglobia bacterium]|nr:hypothetical protein [Terriglobia bacterium]
FVTDERARSGVGYLPVEIVLLHTGGHGLNKAVTIGRGELRGRLRRNLHQGSDPNLSGRRARKQVGDWSNGKDQE